MKRGGGSESTIIVGPSKSVLVYALYILEYVLDLRSCQNYYYDEKTPLKHLVNINTIEINETDVSSAFNNLIYKSNVALLY